MPRAEHAVQIHAPVSVVFDVIANQPERQPEWWRPIELQERVTPGPTQVGSVSRYVYNMLGVKIKGKHEIIEMQPNARLTVKTLSGLDSTLVFTFTSLAPDQTRLHLRVSYTLPMSIIGQLFNRLELERRNEADLREGLQQLKRLIEAEYPQP